MELGPAVCHLGVGEMGWRFQKAQAVLAQSEAKAKHSLVDPLRLIHPTAAQIKREGKEEKKTSS
jgi:hypothetical protein